MNDLGRRYARYASTARGKQTILGVLIGTACVLDIVATMLGRSSVQAHTVGLLFAFAGALLLIAVIFIFTNRKSVR